MGVFQNIFRKKPAALSLTAAQQQHVFQDHEMDVIYIDVGKRNDPELRLWLEWLDGEAGRVHTVRYEALADLQRRRDDARAHAQIVQPQNRGGASAETAKEKALELVRLGAALGASDIHIHVLRDHAEITVRIKKSIRHLRDLTVEDAHDLMIALYRIGPSQDNQIKEFEIQDGGIPGTELEGSGLENVRIVRGPSYPAMNRGAFMSLRLQYRSKTTTRTAIPAGVTLRVPRAPAGKCQLKNMGFDDTQVDRLIYMISKASGAVIMTGPTGSGKSTTMFELTKEKARISPDKRNVCIEQPVEYPIPGSVQLEVINAVNAEEAGAQFNGNMRAAVRMDPDSINIAEIRDAEVALTCFSAAQTGHSVMTTLHVDDIFDFPLRLQNMAFERLAFRVTCNSTIILGLVAQRLVPLLCDHCKQPWSTDDTRMPRLARSALCEWGDTTKLYRANPEGCQHCNHTGTTGVTAVSEVIMTDEELMNDFVSRGVTAARRRFRSRPDADRTMAERAITLAYEGRIDPKSILADVGEIPSKAQLDLDRKRGALERAADQRNAEKLMEEAV